MRKKLSHFSLSASALAASLLVVACGGGGASAPNTVAGSSGFAVDDYLRDATVLCDSNGNGVSDAGESTTRTDSSGFFQFNTACSARLVVTGGTNLDTGLPFTGKLQAPPGATMVTPLTTLMAAGMTLDQISAALDLPTGIDFTQADPARKIGGVLQNPDLFRKTLAVQQLIQKTAESLASVAGAGANAALPTIYSEVAASVAASLRANPTLVSGTAMNTAAVESLVQTATARVQTSAALSTEIKNGLTVNAETLAEVVAGALVKQANAFLESTTTNAAALTAITLTVQGDDTIADFVQQNKTVLASAPSTTTAELAVTLTEDVPGGTTSNPQTPVLLVGTPIVSFDETSLPNLGAFGDAAPSIVLAPAGGTGAALRLDRSGEQNFGGTFFPVATPIAFAADRKTVTARVYSTRANAVIYLKVEGANQAGATQVAATTGAANTWQTLTWVLDGVNTAVSYNTVVFSADTDVPSVGAQTYWIDEVTLANAPVSTTCATTTEQCISFSESTIAALGFEGLVSAEVTADPVVGPSNDVLKLVKGPDGAPWAGATVYTMGTVNPDPAARSVLTIDPVGLGSSKIVTLRSYSGAPVGTKMTLKLENGVEGGQNIAAETVTTVQNGWETLTFDFANPSTSAFSPSVVYNTASIFPAFSIPGAIVPLTADTTFYFDELKYSVASATPPTPVPTGCGVTEPTCAPTTTIPSGALVIYSDAASAGNLDAYPNWGQTTQFAEATIASNKSLKYTNLNYQGMQFDVVDVAAKGKLHLDFWTPNMTSVKVSIISPEGENAYTQTLTQGGWNSVDIDLSNYTVPNLAGIFQIKLEGVPTGGTLYVDNIYFWGSAGSVSSGTFTGAFAVDYVGELFTPSAKTSAGGDFGFFFDPRLNTGQVYDYAGVAGTAQDPGGVPNFYYGKGLALPAITDAYFGAFVKAPNNAAVDVSTFSNLKLRVWGPDQLFRTGSFPVLSVVLQGPPVAGCGSNSGASEVTRTFNTLTQGAASEYTLPLNSFTMKFSCGGQTIAQVLQNVTQFNILLEGSNIQYTTNQPGDAFGNGLNIGPIRFE